MDTIGKSERATARWRVVMLYVSVSIVSSAVCMFASFWAAVYYDLRFTLMERGGTPYFLLVALAVGLMLGTVTACLWAYRFLKYPEAYQPSGWVPYPFRLGLGATAVLHLALPAYQSLVRMEAYPFKVILVAFGILAQTEM